MVSSDTGAAGPAAGCGVTVNTFGFSGLIAVVPTTDPIRPQLGDELENRASSAIHPQLGDEIFCLPWGHIKLIIDKCRQNPEKAEFYVRQSVNNNWSRAVLQNWLDTDLFDRQGKAITNFTHALPTPQSDLAQEITRDPYNFDFIEIATDFNERQLKDALLLNVQQFLMESPVCKAAAGVL